MSHLDLGDPALQLSWLPETVYVVRLAPTVPLPSSILSVLSAAQPPSAFISHTRTPAETSVIIRTALLPAFDELKASIPDGHVEGPWSIFRVQGPLELHMTGVMARLAEALSKANVALFASSTFDTDYVLVHDEDKVATQTALKRAGWRFA